MIIDYASRPPVPEFGPKGAGHLARYREVYSRSEEAAEKLQGDLAGYLAEYDKAGVSHVCIKARDLETTYGWRIRNEDVAEFCAQQGPRFIGFAGVDPNKGMTAVRELDHAVRNLGLRGLNLQCFEHKLAINDRKMYPLYAKCIELDIPVNIHCSINFATSTYMKLGHPMLLDEVMVDFPELRVCASPPGFPWVHELIGVAWRHANVRIGLVAVRPKYLTVAGSGYEPLLQYGRTILKDRIIFGSAYPLGPIGRAVAEIDALPIEDSVKQLWMHDNAKAFLRL
ncbi:MAG: amidohydrolase family protein [Proteobacteria bacterium]|nr:amidohydrolase family protein [Pseudomonadota bacterium]